METAENALRAREEQIKMMDQYLVTAHTQKMEFQNSQRAPPPPPPGSARALRTYWVANAGWNIVKKDREASVALASASQCQHELDELQSTHEEQVGQGASGRVVAPSHRLRLCCTDPAARRHEAACGGTG